MVNIPKSNKDNFVVFIKEKFTLPNFSLPPPKKSFVNHSKKKSQILFQFNVSDLLDILHPLGHLLVAHVVDILDEVVVFLPERHNEAALDLVALTEK